VSGSENAFRTSISSVFMPSPRTNSLTISILVTLGGAGEKRTLKIGAKYADVVHIITNSTEELEHKVEVLRKHCANVNRDFSSIRIATGLRPLLDPSPQEVKSQVEWVAARRGISTAEAEKLVQRSVGAKNILHTIGEYQRLNVALITFNIISVEEVKSLNDQVIPKLNREENRA